MPVDTRQLLEVLRSELSYLEQGGFDREQVLFGTASPFVGTPGCINLGDPLRRHECGECCLSEFVPEGKREEKFPCHHIALNAAGETIASLMTNSDPQRLPDALEHWLRNTIALLEERAERKSA